ncbi:MAG: hypothetical protein HY608_00425 [Planctomycetes bacterium]|nr:hypothetical protein [Planctomycetota bacterium]
MVKRRAFVVKEDERQAPLVLAMVLCDHLWRDPASGKVTLVGTFSAVTAREFPARHPEMALYAAITRAEGKMPVVIRVIKLQPQATVMAELSATVEFKNLDAVAEFGVDLQDLVFPAPGPYSFQVATGGSVLAERRVMLVQRSNEEVRT